jgi:large subunit ribosomal protein L17
MRHNRSYRKLGRTSEHRRALFRNQLRSLITHERIVTTLPKAKELRPIAEKVVTLGRQADSVHARRLVGRMITDRDLIKRLFTEIGPRFVSRPGGYTRIVKLGPRAGDGAELAILEFVDFKLPEAKGKAAEESKKEKKRKKPAAATAEAAAPK